MKPNEENYLQKYRELVTLERKIKNSIGDLHQICESLKDWRKTAADLANVAPRVEWTEERIRVILVLRNTMILFDGLNQQVVSLWNHLSEQEKEGLTSPFSK